MTQTIAALLFAHVLGDFVLQSNRMAATKGQAGTLSLHGLIVLSTAVTATGNLSPWLLALTAAHLAIDLVKSRLPATLWPFLADQAVHAATIVACAALAPKMWADGLWSGHPLVPGLMALTAGAVIATRAGGFAIGLLMVPWAAHAPPGLPGGGGTIGNLERGLIFLLILTGQAQSIGFLIAAKSVLRFGSISTEKEVSEYVIIGTLASFSWGIVAALATTALLFHLPTLGIPDLLP